MVEKFDRDKERFTHSHYNEAQLREQFVNRFFRALGWDLGEQVLHEAGLRSGGTIKHPDYTFLAGSRRAFYVETKKPSIDIGNSIEPAEQLRSYGWSGNTALGILTNFAEFAVYDCRIEPKQGDSPAEARIMYLTHSQYLDQWDRLQETLSPEAVRQGKHSDLLETTAKGVLRVDEAFLRDMETWRVDLAEHLHKQARFIDRTLNQRELNHLVQRTIDRIVFLRIAEDRNLESYGRLERAATGKGVYAQIKKLYLAADRRYNSGLFHFNPADKSRPDADTLSLDIYIVDNVLRRIINRLYPPESRYQFSVISADILGQVYERFLGKVIEVRSDGETTDVTVEEKPEVRKAGGVYYTPGYIVDYIVQNTVGDLLKDKSPDAAMSLRVLDPACGSGSFLTGAYQYLLDWHLAQYRENPERWKNRVRHSADGIILRIEEKRRILLDNIYGVDLDQNAVEVSKLSLLLKMLENEGDTLEIEEPLLPDLSGNIKWGNSLIGSDFFSGDKLAETDDEELLRVKPFDWTSASGFGSIMATGGFDAVIGNPPYGAWFDVEQGTYFARNYPVFKGVKDVYVAFIERAVTLAKLQGYISFIVPSAWTGGPRYRKLRDYLIEYTFKNMVLLPYDVFADAYVDTLIFVLKKEKWNQEHRVCTHVYGKREKVTSISLADHEWDIVKQAEWHNIDNRKFVLDSDTIGILSTIRNSCSNQFGEVVDVKRGVLFDRNLLTDSKASENSHPYFEGDVYRYLMNYRAENWIEFDDKLKERPKEFHWFQGERLLLRRLVNRRQRLMAILVKDTVVTNKNLYSVIAKPGISAQVVLALLNSKLFSYLYLKQVTQATKDDFPQVTIRDIKSLPIPSVAVLQENSDKLVELVERMLDLHRQANLTAVQRGLVEQRIEAVDREIDELVYRLYGLSEDERRIVEGG